MVAKFAGLVLALLFIHEVMVLQLHFAMAARELPSSVMAVGDRLVKIQPDRKKKLAPPAPKANSPQHYKPPVQPNGRPHVEPVRPSPPPLSPPPSS
nr:hypothetical protein Iba_chr05bCG8900 [Ipomoea batatas]